MKINNVFHGARPKHVNMVIDNTSRNIDLSLRYLGNFYAIVKLQMVNVFLGARPKHVNMVIDNNDLENGEDTCLTKSMKN